MRFSSIFNKKFVTALLACAFFASVTAFAEVGRSGWPIFGRTEAANTRGITSATNNFNSSLSGLFYNPALIGSKTQKEIFFLSEAGFAGDHLGGFLYGLPLKKGMIAGGLVGYDAGTMELNWMQGGQLQSENVNAERDYLGEVAYGIPLRRNLLVGGALKVASSEIAQRSSALAVGADVGAAYLPSDKVTLSAAIQNIGVSSKFIDKDNPLPASLYFGGGYAMKIKDYHLLSGVGFTYNMVDQTFHPEIGVELRYGMVSLNAGYRFNSTDQVLQLGLGFQWHDIEFGYAYIPGIYLDSTHRINISYRFAGPAGKTDEAKKNAPATAATAKSGPATTTTAKTAAVTKSSSTPSTLGSKTISINSVKSTLRTGTMK